MFVKDRERDLRVLTAVVYIVFGWLGNVMMMMIA